MDNSRVRLKIGPHEFEAEGSEESVKARLMEFRDLISGSPLERTRGGTDAPAPPPAPEGLPLIDAPFAKPAASKLSVQQVDLVFHPEPGRQGLSLRILPSTDKGVIRQISNTMLVILFGYKEKLGVLEVPVIQITAAMRQSGFTTLKRLSTSFSQLQKEGLALKIGAGKGTKYRATNKGLQLAEDLLHSTLARANL